MEMPTITAAGLISRDTAVERKRQPIGVREAPCKRSALPYCPVNREPVPKHDIRVGRANQDYEHAFFKRHFDLSALRSLEKVRSASARGLPDSPRRMAAGTKATVWRRRRPWFWRMCGPGGFDRCYPGARHRGSLVQISRPARFAGHGADGPRRGSGADAHVGEPSSLHSRKSSPSVGLGKAVSRVGDGESPVP